MSDSVRPHRRQLTRLPRPWDSPGKNTGGGCHFLLQCMKAKSESEVAQSCPTPSDPMDCSLPGSSVHGIFQARVLEWSAIAFSTSITISYLFRPVYTLLMLKRLQRFLYFFMQYSSHISYYIKYPLTNHGIPCFLYSQSCVIITIITFSSSQNVTHYP